MICSHIICGCATLIASLVCRICLDAESSLYSQSCCICVSRTYCTNSINFATILILIVISICQSSSCIGCISCTWNIRPVNTSVIRLLPLVCDIRFMIRKTSCHFFTSTRVTTASRSGERFCIERRRCSIATDRCHCGVTESCKRSSCSFIYSSI